MTNALKRILLVEDNAEDADLALVALAEQKLADEVAVVHDGEQALAYLRRQGGYAGRLLGNPSVVLLDLKMPKVDGLEVLREMKADPRLKMIPVVMLTSSAEEKDLFESYQLGANAYIVKPVNFNEFLHAVKTVGLFWATLNEPPPGTIKSVKNTV